MRWRTRLMQGLRWRDQLRIACGPAGHQPVHRCFAHPLPRPQPGRRGEHHRAARADVALYAERSRSARRLASVGNWCAMRWASRTPRTSSPTWRRPWSACLSPSAPALRPETTAATAREANVASGSVSSRLRRAPPGLEKGPDVLQRITLVELGLADDAAVHGAQRPAARAPPRRAPRPACQRARCTGGPSLPRR